MEAAAVVADFPLVGAVVVAGVAAGAARKAARKAAKQHRSSVAADCVAHTADEPSATPVVARRKRRLGGGEDLRPASRGRHPETWARNNYKKHTGLHLRVWHGGEMTAEIDHAAIPFKRKPLDPAASRRFLLTRGAALFGLGQTSDTDYPTVLLGTSSASRWWPG